MIIINHFIPRFCSDCKPNFILQAAINDKFDLRYIYWGKSYCKDSICEEPLEKFSTSKVIYVNKSYGNCENIVVLGDSFTDSPWDYEGKPYAEHFVDRLSVKNHNCYRLIRIATNGTGNDQQFARFTDIVKFLRPKLVIWQFYWNDLFDNVEKPLYSLEGDSFHREKSFKNFYFWSGWIYQKLPIVKNTNLGDFLLYFGELKKDASVDWFHIESDPNLLLDFNNKKITFLLNEMKVLEKKYNFKLVTTMSPLECEVIDSNGCAKLDEQQGFVLYDSFLRFQNEMTNILQNNSRFISMYKNESMSSLEMLDQSDFWKQEKIIGVRHLGASGQEKVGNILFFNFIFKEKAIYEDN